jgi:hypothetical protein
MPPDSSHAPVFPVRPACPLWLLAEWAEVFRTGLRSRTKVLLEVRPESDSASERRFVLVRYRPGGAPLAPVLPGVLRAQCITWRDAGIDRWTVGRVFRQMHARRQSVVAIPLTQWGGAAVFVRRAADDPTVARLAAFNALSPRPPAWAPAAPRSYPEPLRKEYVRRARRSSGDSAAPRR